MRGKSTAAPAAFVLPWGSGRRAPVGGPAVARAAALREGNALWAADPHRVQDAIDKVEQAWVLTRDPKIAIQLATMYDKANRNDDALVVLREAFRKDPQKRCCAITRRSRCCGTVSRPTSATSSKAC